MAGTDRVAEASGVPPGEECGPLAGGATTLPQAARATAAATVTVTAWAAAAVRDARWRAAAVRDARIGRGTGG